MKSQSTQLSKLRTWGSGSSSSDHQVDRRRRHSALNDRGCPVVTLKTITPPLSTSRTQTLPDMVTVKRRKSGLSPNRIHKDRVKAWMLLNSNDRSTLTNRKANLKLWSHLLGRRRYQRVNPNWRRCEVTNGPTHSSRTQISMGSY